MSASAAHEKGVRSAKAPRMPTKMAAKPIELRARTRHRRYMASSGTPRRVVQTFPNPSFKRTRLRRSAGTWSRRFRSMRHGAAHRTTIFGPSSLRTSDTSHVTWFRGRREQRIREMVPRAGIALRRSIRKLFPRDVAKNKHYDDKQSFEPAEGLAKPAAS
jgi:hypothetical protein